MNEYDIKYPSTSFIKTFSDEFFRFPKDTFKCLYLTGHWHFNIYYCSHATILQAWVNAFIFWLQKKETGLIFIYKPGKSLSILSHLASTTVHLYSLSCNTREKGFANHFCCLPAESPQPARDLLQASAQHGVYCNPNWEFLARNGCEQAHNIKQEEGFQFSCVHLGSFVVRKDLAGFPLLSKPRKAPVTWGLTCWHESEEGNSQDSSFFSMILMQSVMLRV